MSAILYPDYDVVFVNSFNRLSGGSTNFSINVTQQLRPNNEYDSVVVSSGSCPKSWYSINEYNYQFTLTEGKSSVTVSIPQQSYTAQSLATQLTTTLTAASPNLYTYTVTINANTAKFTYTVSSGNSSFTFSNNSPWRAMGFNIGTVTFSASTLTSANVVNMNFTNVIYVLLDCILNQNNILCVLRPNQSADFSSYTYFAGGSEPFIIRPLTKANQVLNFSLISDRGLPIDLNGLDWELQLIFFKSNDYYKKLIQDKQLELLQRNVSELKQ